MRRLKRRTINIFLILISAGFLTLGVTYFKKQYENMDSTSPVITMDSDVLECKIDSSTKELLSGVTATDNKDGDITEHIMISNIALNTDINETDTDNKISQKKSSKKNFEITYAVFDSSNNMATAKRTLVYKDYHSPRFQLDSDLRFTSKNNVDPLSFITAEDCIDGDISGQITLASDDGLDMAEYGIHRCTAKVTNSLGDTSEIPLVVKVLDTTSEEESNKPLINLTEYITYIKEGEELTPEDFLYSVIIDNTEYLLLDAEEEIKAAKEELKQKEQEPKSSSDGLTKTSTLPKDAIGKTDFGYYNYLEGYNFIDRNEIKIKSEVDMKNPGSYTVRYSMKHPVEGIEGYIRLIVVVE